MKLEMEAFSSLRYVGVQTAVRTDFSELKHAIKCELENTTVRSPRQPSVVFQTLKVSSLSLSVAIALLQLERERKPKQIDFKNNQFCAV